MKTQILFAIIGGAGFGVGLGTAFSVVRRSLGPGRSPAASSPPNTPVRPDSGAAGTEASGPAVA